MQKLFCPFLIVLSLVSCSQDEKLPEKNPESFNPTRKNLRALPEVYPENRANMYDITGSLYYRISESYLNTVPATPLITEIILSTDALADAEASFLVLKPDGYVSPLASDIGFLADASVPVINKVAKLPISDYAKSIFLGFTEKLILLHTNKELSMAIHKYVVDFETVVLTDAGLTGFDRQVILSATSVARYAVHFANTHRKRKPRDRDWEISNSCIIAAALGGSRNTTEAITSSVVAAMLQNVEY